LVRYLRWWWADNKVGKTGDVSVGVDVVVVVVVGDKKCRRVVTDARVIVAALNVASSCEVRIQENQRSAGESDAIQVCRKQ